MQYTLFVSALLLSLLNFLAAQYQFACPPSFCSQKVGPCRKIECSDGRIIRNATECGCCDVCVKSLGEGENCLPLTKEFATIPDKECGPGLTCIEGKCSPANTRCIQDQLRHDENEGLRDMMTSRPRPECDDFGDYKPVVCRPGMLCFCVDRFGKRIFGTAPSTENTTMNCNCSRDYVEFRGEMKRPDQFLLCMENGNYDPLQCTDDYCFCLSEDSQLDWGPIDVNTTIAALKCFDPDRHKNFDKILRSKCWRERDLVEEQLHHYRKKGITVVGVDLPKCDLDGTYSPIKCKEDTCMCVKKDGNPYKHVGATEVAYKVKRNSDLAINMNCRCAREKELLHGDQLNNAAASTFAQFKCMPNGNYRPFQCIDSMCFCIDDMGFQIEEAVLMIDRQFLDCYKSEYENDLA